MNEQNNGIDLIAAERAGCIICREEVQLCNQESHLRTKHAAPVKGYRFWWDAVAHFTDKPSVLIGDLHREFGNPFGRVAQEIDGELVYYSDAQSVDLTREPHFFIILPATM